MNVENQVSWVSMSSSSAPNPSSDKATPSRSPELDRRGEPLPERHRAFFGFAGFTFAPGFFTVEAFFGRARPSSVPFT